MAVSDMETSLGKMNETLELQKKLLMSLKTQQQKLSKMKPSEENLKKNTNRKSIKCGINSRI